jgi:hypothetical protein
LHAFALAYEERSDVSLGFTADVLRVLDSDGVRPRELPRRAGVASPALKTALGIPERDWTKRFGGSRIGAALEAIVVGDGARSPLWAGLEPPAGSWRAKVAPLPLLPHFPMPRQCGHPDGV